MKQTKKKTPIEFKLSYLFGMTFFVVGWVIFFQTPPLWDFDKIMSILAIIVGIVFLWDAK